MSPEANLLKLAYIDINALLVEGFDTSAEDLVGAYRAHPAPHTVRSSASFPYPTPLLAVAQTLTEIRDLFGADKI